VHKNSKAMRRFLKFFLLIIFFTFNVNFLLLASGDNSLPTKINASPEFLEKGRFLFLKFCAHCHGNHGGGDGFNAEFIDKDPAELSDPQFQAKKSNEKIFRVISLGGSKVKKSHLMPPFGNTLSEEEIWSLVAFIRQLGKDKTLVVLPKDVQLVRPLMPEPNKQDIVSFSKWFDKNGQTKAQTDAGKILVMNKKSCLGCHQLNDEGGRIGPNLNRSSFNYKPEWLYAWVSNPQYFRPNTKMPNLGLEPEEARAIVSYLVSFQPDEEGKKNEVSDLLKKYLTVKGDPKRGYEIFSDPEGIANCAKCHLVNDFGGVVGPELSFVGTSRTREFLLESILDPSAVISSGYKTMMILTKGRKFITGIKTNEDETGFYLINKEGKEVYIPKSKIKKSKSQKISTMPGNFKDLLKVKDVADILAYLSELTLPAMTASVN
jgi:putative heme-binding domain-containing protein